MFLLPRKYGEGRLRIPVEIYLEHFGAVDGGLPVVIFFDQIDHKV